MGEDYTYDTAAHIHSRHRFRTKRNHSLQSC
jgi:hypothetical protein